MADASTTRTASSKDTIKASADTLKMLRPLAEAIEELGKNKNVEKGAENFYRIGKALNDFSDLNVSKLTRNAANIDSIKDVIKKLADSISGKDLSNFQPRAAMLGVGISNISKGLDSFSKLNIKSIGSNVKELRNISSLVDELVLNFTSSFISEEFAKDAQLFGEPLAKISGGLKAFESLDFQGIKNNFLQLQGIPQLVDSIIYGLSPIKLSDTFTRAGEEFGEPLEKISSGLIKFSELSFLKIVKNAFMLALFGKTVMQALRLFPKIQLQKETAESFSHLTSISNGLISFASIKFGSLLKNVALLAIFGKTLKLLTILDGGVSLKKTAEEFGEPLGKIADALIKFSSIKWGKVLLSTILFRTFNKLFKGTGISTTVSGVSADKPAGKKDKKDPQVVEQKKLNGLFQSFFTWWTDGDMKREQDQERMIDAIEGIHLEVPPGGDKGDKKDKDKKDDKRSWMDKIKDYLKDQIFNKLLPSLIGPLGFIPGLIIGWLGTIGKTINESLIGRGLRKVLSIFGKEGAIGKLFAAEGPFARIGKLFSEEGAIGKVFFKIKNLFSSEGAIGGIFGKIVTLFENNPIGKSLLKFFNLGKKLANIFGFVFFAFEGITGFFEGFKKGGVLEGIKTGIVNAVDSVLGIFIDLPAKFFGWIAGLFGWDNLATVLKEFSFKENLRQTVEFISTKGGELLGDFIIKIIDFFESFSKKLMGFFDKFSLKDILDMSIGELLGKVTSGVVSMFTKISNGVVEVFDSITDKLASSISDLISGSMEMGNNVSELFKEMVRSVLPDPKKGFLGKLLSNVIPDSVYKWAGVDNTTGALIPTETVPKIAETKEEAKSAEKPKPITADKTDMAASKSTDKTDMGLTKKEWDVINAKMKVDEEAALKSGKEFELDYAKYMDDRQKKLYSQANIDSIDKRIQELSVKPEEKDVSALRDFKTVWVDNPNFGKVDENGKKNIYRKTSKKVERTEEEKKKWEEQYQENLKADEVKRLKLIENYKAQKEEEQNRLAILQSPDLKPADVKPVGKAIDVISSSNESAKQDAMSAAVISPVKNNNVTNNNSSSSTTVINSNIPDRTFSRYGSMQGAHAY